VVSYKQEIVQQLELLFNKNIRREKMKKIKDILIKQKEKMKKENVSRKVQLIRKEIENIKSKVWVFENYDFTETIFLFPECNYMLRCY
jgi:hypothetical protein